MATKKKSATRKRSSAKRARSDKGTKRKGSRILDKVDELKRMVEGNGVLEDKVNEIYNDIDKLDLRDDMPDDPSRE